MKPSDLQDLYRLQQQFESMGSETAEKTSKA